MQDTEFYSALLGLRHPWKVREVTLDLPGDRVDVWVEEVTGAVWECPECGEGAPVYDHAQERVWRHRNTCQCQTYLHGRLPRVKCSEQGTADLGTLGGSWFAVHLAVRELVDRHVEGM